MGDKGHIEGQAYTAAEGGAAVPMWGVRRVMASLTCVVLVCWLCAGSSSHPQPQLLKSILGLTLGPC